ncbi:MAG: hypothetical protein JNK82_35875 [Myxococcaceae bacterium]|nr:hypothetical protein [Myxococcaceae bacterium]
MNRRTMFLVAPLPFPRRRRVLQLLAAGVCFVALEAAAGPLRRRRVRRRIRRRVRRRIRRRVIWRAVGPRRALVVPLALAVGWELAVDNRVVVVHEVRPDVIVVVDPKTNAKEEIAAVKEDTPDNGKELEGTLVAENDAGPFRENEEDVEEEVDE